MERWLENFKFNHFRTCILWTDEAKVEMFGCYAQHPPRTLKVIWLFLESDEDHTIQQNQRRLYFLFLNSEIANMMH